MTVKVSHLTADTMALVLNRLVELDQAAIHEFCERRLPINDALADAPGVTSAAREDGPGSTMGLVGLMQPFFSVLGRRLVAHSDGDGRLTRFSHEAWPEAAIGPPFLSATDVLRAS